METFRTVVQLFFLLLEILCYAAVLAVFIGLLWIGLHNFLDGGKDEETGNTDRL